MLRKIVLLGIFLSCLGYTFAATKAQEKEGSSNSPTQTAQSDKRGTKDSPLVIDTRTIHSDEETAEEAQRVAEQQRVNTWNIRLTFVIAVCAFLQFGGIVAQVIVYLKQTKIMKDTLTTMGIQATDAREASAQSANIANRTLIATFRPKLIVRSVAMIRGTSIPTIGERGIPWVVEYTITNIGGSEAEITHLVPSIVLLENKILPAIPPYEEANRYKSVIKLKPGAHKECRVEIPEDTVSYLRMMGNSTYPNQTDYIYFIGYLRFRDGTGTERSLGFCRHRDPKTKRFIAVEDPDYEYAD